MRRSAIPLVVLLMVLGLAAACSKARSDQAITTDIQSKMFSDPQLKAANVSVQTNKGEVTLSGDIPSDAARYEAFKLASETPGVTKVRHYLCRTWLRNLHPRDRPQSLPCVRAFIGL